MDGFNDGTLRPLYGRFGWAYDLLVSKPAGGTPAEVARQIASLGVPSGSLIIDAGSGTGRYSEQLSDGGFRVVGVDSSRALVEQAMARNCAATFACADLLEWESKELATCVLCRGVLNDLLDDEQRQAVFAVFGSWLLPGGFLVADVRDWDATVARYADAPRQERSVGDARRSLDFSSETTLEPEKHLMLVNERYEGVIEGAPVKERYQFTMRCWTTDELRELVAGAGFSKLEIRRGAEAGIAPDRLSLTARCS